MQPELKSHRVLSALQEFDRELRNDPSWAGWEENRAHKYAILHNGKTYPVKKIASLASGVPVSEFSGGEYPGHTNGLLKKAGFTVVPLRVGNPDWVRDELIVALDFYLRHRNKIPDKDSSEIRSLSGTIKGIGERLFLSSQRSQTFRNSNGVYMKLMNFRRLDPEYTTAGKSGLTGGAKEELVIWREYAEDPLRCNEVARAIIQSINELENADPPSNEVDDSTEDEASEGRLLTRIHITRERQPKLVKRKKQQALKIGGKLCCEVCDFEFGSHYGDRGVGYIECHHTKPLSKLTTTRSTHINDLALVCANCHRMIHRGKRWLSIDELRKIFRVIGSNDPSA